MIGNLGVGLLLADALAVLVTVTSLKSPPVVVAMFAAALVTFRLLARVYRHRFGISWVNDLPRTTGSTLAAGLVTLAMVRTWGQGSDVEVILLAVVGGGVAGVLHLVAMVLVRGVRRRWDLGSRTVILGEGPVTSRLAALMRSHREFGMQPVAVLGKQVRNEPLAKLVRRTHAEVVVLAFSAVREAEVLDEVIHVTRSGVTLFVVPRLFEVHPDSPDVERLQGYPLVRFRVDPTTRGTWLVKRAADTAGAVMLLVLTAPLLAMGMLLVYLDSGRPVFFRQIRLGRDGKQITIIKLRSMRPVPESQSDTTWSEESRATRVGRFLRRTSLDELPQLFNILRGEMSFVGPRPERPDFVRQFSQKHARYWARHRVPVGLTGLAQVSGLRGNTSIEDRARFDNSYIANWSLWLDCKILIQTAKELLFPARVIEERAWGAGRPSVVHVSQPTTAGVAQVVLDLVRDQVARGWDVHVVCPGGSGRLLTDARTAGASTHAWEAGRKPGHNTLGETRRLRALLTRIDPDLVHLHSAKAGLAGRLALRGSRPTIFQPHAWSFEAVTGKLRIASVQWERLGSRWTDVTICVSAAEQALGRRLGCLGRRSVVVPNGVDLERFRDRDRNLALAALGRDTSRSPLVVCIGRVDQQKGQDFLLQAWQRVLKEHPRAHLVIVGDGPQLSELKALSPQQVEFVGNSDQVPIWLAAADVVAIPSRWEGMPLLAIEAMASARPCVGFDVNGMAECLGEVGLLVPVGDIEGLAAGINAYLAEPERRLRDGALLRARAEMHLSLHRTMVGIASVSRGLSGITEQTPREIDIRTKPYDFSRQTLQA